MVGMVVNYLPVIALVTMPVLMIVFTYYSIQIYSDRINRKIHTNVVDNT